MSDHRSSRGCCNRLNCRRGPTVLSPMFLLFVLSINTLPSLRVQNKPAKVRLFEVKHIGQRTGLGIERLTTNAAQIPIVFNEAKNRRLVGGRVVDEVHSRVR